MLFFPFRKNNNQIGFTLIELLVVVAIIGLLASVVLASLNSARIKSRDAAIKSQLSSIRVAADLIYSNTGTYDTVCSLSTNAGLIFKGAFDNSEKVLNQSVCSGSTTSILYANSSGVLAGGGKGAATPDKWGASIKLLSNANYFCVDYTGVAREQSSIGIYFTVEGTTDVNC